MAWRQKAMEASEKGDLSSQIELWIEEKESDFSSRQIGMHDMQPKFPIRESLKTAVIEKAEIPGGGLPHRRKPEQPDR